MEPARKREVLRRAAYGICFTFGMGAPLPYNLSWFICFWALSHLVFERSLYPGEVDSRPGWPLLAGLFLLPIGVFHLHETFPLEFNTVFEVATPAGTEELFPGVFYGALYFVSIAGALFLRARGVKFARLEGRHLLLMALTVIPFVVTNIRQLSYYHHYFESFSCDTLLVSGVKPFYFNGLWEEFYYRGLLLSLLIARVRVWPAIVISSLMFTLGHYDLFMGAGGMEISLLAERLFGVLGLGIVTAYVCWRSGSVWPGVLFHCLSSGSAYLTTYLVRCVH